MGTKPTFEQAQLHLQVFEERREARLRQARDWFFTNCFANTWEEAMRIAAPGTEGGTNFMMVVSYWEQACALLNYGLLHEDLFFETTGEQWGLWEQVKPIIGEWRAMFASPKLFGNLEEQCRRLEAWREKRNPGSNEALRKVYAQMSQAVQAAKAKAAAS